MGTEDDGSTWDGGDGPVPSDASNGTAATGSSNMSGDHRPELASSRYRVQRRLAHGGQGDVWIVADERLGREQALKIVRAGASPTARNRFLDEIERTVYLAHPGVVAVSDQGIAQDGRPWFLMRRVRGDHFGKVVRQVFDGGRPRNLRRLIELLASICSAVEHAHGLGILHRDLTPRNVMVGEFGEALVMDWGLARSLPETTPVRTVIRKGRPAGTRGYIAPECYVDPDHLHAQVDVFGLGGILFKALSGQDPPENRAPTRRDFGPMWADGQSLPGELVTICVEAMAPDPARRMPSAAALRQQLMDWLDGARRRDEALAMVDQARGLLPRIAGERKRADDLRRRAALARQAVPGHAPAEQKYDAWALEDLARAEDDQLALTELEIERLLGAALTRVPELGIAHELLARHHRTRAETAEVAGDRNTARRAEALVRRHQRGEHAQWLDGLGGLDLITEPAGARVTLHRLVSNQRRLVPGSSTPLGVTPIVGRVLARGSYVAILEAEGRPPVRYPIHIERGEHWDAVAPGENQPTPIKLVDPGEGGVYVPAGWARLGGDPQASSPLARCRIWVDGFVIQRFSVTHRQWLAFLDDLEASGDAEGADRYQPRRRDGRPLYERGADGERYAESDFGDGRIEPDAPLALVDWTSAVAYAEWLTARTGHPWRLPTPCEWEKAARGVDGRLMPWGDEAEPSWYRTVASFAGRPEPVVVGECPEDESVYGVRDMAGTIRNWCITSYRVDPPEGDRDRILPPEGARREVRGGCWTSQPSLCQPAGRMATRFDQQFRSIGVRLVYSVD